MRCPSHEALYGVLLFGFVRWSDGDVRGVMQAILEGCVRILEGQRARVHELRNLVRLVHQADLDWLKLKREFFGRALVVLFSDVFAKIVIG